MFRYFIVYKPYQVLSQFSGDGSKTTLNDLFAVPKNVYPLGRLDYDSEGLLILTSDPSLNHRLLHPSHKHSRTYWVQVEGDITDEALRKLSAGIRIHVNGSYYTTLPAAAVKLLPPPAVPERNPPIRFRKNIPSSWLSLTLTEGKNRQVRKMTAATGFPTLRLIRYQIADIILGSMQPGDMQEWSREAIYAGLFP
jgi:23S rRNA pseudouridine2457 synthase